MISFNYNQNLAFASTNSQSYSSQHIISTARVLKFTYQKAEPLPIVYEMPSFQPVPYQVLAQPFSSRPSYASQAGRASKKINLISNKHRRQKNQSTTLPKYQTTQLQQNQTNHLKERSVNQSFHQDKISKVSQNPEANYTYIIPNHISLEQNEKASCGLFTKCGQNELKRDDDSKENGIKVGESTGNTKSIKPSDKQQSNQTRQRIFEEQKISAFIIQQIKMQNNQQKILENALQMSFPLEKVKYRQTQRHRTSRRPIFRLVPLSQHKMCRVVEESIQIDDVPPTILQKWQNIKSQIKQRNAEKQSNCCPPNQKSVHYS